MNTLIELKEELYGDGFVRHYATDGADNYYILQTDTNILYEDAIDLIPCQHTYMATDKKIEPIDESKQ